MQTSAKPSTPHNLVWFAYKHLPPQYLYILQFKHFPYIFTFPIISSLLSINILPKLLNYSSQATGQAITFPSVVIERAFQPAEHLKYGYNY